MSAVSRPPTGLPSPALLTELQRYGVSCVHCGVMLTMGAAVELGTRYHEVDAVTGRTAWYPRSCQDCHTERGAA
ncbi:hypothetical protein [Streptomyces sp. TRM49041]|uniref:hypothetical protein n=1 Tax=Streptomyces sp. TRM49041 TaxID=2603216 RepID=UPI0011EFA472|nr:hypothetical protein [Streptomyces sp. TRM49041]